MATIANHENPFIHNDETMSDGTRRWVSDKKLAMQLVLVNRIREVNEKNGEVSFYPDLPDSLEWGQASSLWEKHNKTLVWTRATPAELDEIVAGGGKMLGQAAPIVESDRMVAALRTQPSNWPDVTAKRAEMFLRANAAQELKTAAARQRFVDARKRYDDASEIARAFHRGPEQEFIAAYRGIAKSAEKRQKVKDVAKGLGKLVLMLGVGGLATWLMIRGHSSEVAWGMATLAADNFNRSNRSLDGDTMSDGSSTWALGDNGGWEIESNKAISLHLNPPNANQFCNSMDQIEDVEASLNFMGNYRVEGISLRYTDANNFYSFENYSENNKARLRKRVAGSNTWLSSGYSLGFYGWDLCKFKVEGTSLTGYISGVVRQGPITDGAHSTGRAGLTGLKHSGGDNFLAESIPTENNVYQKMAIFKSFT